MAALKVVSPSTYQLLSKENETMNEKNVPLSISGSGVDGKVGERRRREAVIGLVALFDESGE